MSKIRFFKASFASYVVLMYTEFEGFFTYKDIRREKFTMCKATGSLKSHVNEIAVYDQPVCDDKEPQFKKKNRQQSAIYVENKRQWKNLRKWSTA